ncbi:hypothetical protein PQX77_006051 [Marasmius sp. AFHP31]|nr:hypothetical protein PQX77_006051 [Marasmius sp. AFHP31]
MVEDDGEESCGKDVEEIIHHLDLILQELSQLKGRLKDLQALRIRSRYEHFLLSTEALVEFFDPRYFLCYSLVPRLPSTFADIVELDIRLDFDPNSLSLLRSLERFILSIHGSLIDLIKDDDYTSTALSKVLRMLTAITSPHLRTIVLHLIDDSNSTAETEPISLVLSDEWNRLDDLFSTEKFAECAIELIVPSSTSDDDLGTARQMAFPKSHHTGRLSVVRAPLPVIDEFSSGAKTGRSPYRPYMKEIEWVCNRRY